MTFLPRNTAIIYMVIGGSILAISLTLLLVLLFVQGFVYWYFIFGCIMGGLLCFYGVSMLIRFCQAKRYLEENPPEVRAQIPQAAMEIPDEVIKANLPEATAPPSQFIQDFDTSGEIELKQFDVGPVEYGSTKNLNPDNEKNV
jgi:hypothetical protein